MVDWPGIVLQPTISNVVRVGLRTPREEKGLGAGRIKERVEVGAIPALPEELEGERGFPTLAHKHAAEKVAALAHTRDGSHGAPHRNRRVVGMGATLADEELADVHHADAWHYRGRWRAYGLDLQPDAGQRLRGEAEQRRVVVGQHLFLNQCYPGRAVGAALDAENMT